jgi:hypothetical protein
MPTTLFILNDPPYGTERSYNALRLARSLSNREGEDRWATIRGDRLMKSLAVVLVLTLLFPCAATVFAQEGSGTVGPLSVGAELDVLPYITGGWYGSGWLGVNHVRVRLVASKVNPPDFTLKGDFTNGETQAYAALMDYFLRPSFKGGWIGGGIEHWDNRVAHPAETARGTYHDWMATVGGGWVFGIGPHLYLNPWAAGHWRVAGDTQAFVGSRLYEPRKALAEGSVKIGWRF